MLHLIVLTLVGLVTVKVDGFTADVGSVCDAAAQLKLQPANVKSIHVNGVVARDDLAKIAETYPAVEVFTMNADSSVEGGVVPSFCFARSKLVSVTLHGVSVVEKGAFQKCDRLQSALLGSVKELGAVAFGGCSRLTKVECAKIVRIGEGAFEDCTSLCSFRVPEGVLELPKSVFHGCVNMTELSIDGAVEMIPEHFFTGMPLLRKVAIPITVKKCDSFGFSNAVVVTVTAVSGYCPSGDSVDLLPIVNDIGDHVLKGCSQIKKIHVPSRIKRIGVEAFADMEKLSEVVMDEPSELEHISSYAMARCPSLKSITIPRSVRTVGTEIFGESWQLRQIYIYRQFDTEWYSEGLLSETHAKMIEIQDPLPDDRPNNFDKMYRSFPLRPPQKPLTEEEKKPKHTSNKKPNIVFYFTDQQRWDTIGPNGQKLDITPFVDQLAREGVNFVNCFCNQPVCGPVRAVIQSGQYATAVNCHKNAQILPLDLKYRLADQLKAAGYNLGYIGKWHLASNDQYHYETVPVPVEFRGGWDQFWVGADVPGSTSHGYGGYLFDQDGNTREFSGYRADCMTDHALDFIRNYDDEKPFFLFISHQEPHHQNDHAAYEGPVGSKEMFKDFEPPPDCRPGKGDWERWMPDYLGCCWSLDKNLGRIMHALKEKNIYDDTVIIFTSDHGCHFKVINDVEPGGGDDYKRTAYETAIHIPFIIKGPGFEGGKVQHQLISSIDWPPTFMRLVGGEIGATWKGRPIQECESEDWENVVYIQISESFVGRAIRTDRYCYVIHAAGQNPYKEPGSDKLTWTDKHLWDVKNDPTEQRELKNDPDYQEIKAELRKILIRKAQEAGEGTLRIVDNNPEVTKDL